MVRRLPHLLVFLLVGAAYLWGWLAFLDHKLVDQRFSLTPRDASNTLLVVAIDAPSLSSLGTWPWPRDYHAELLDTLFQAGAKQVALDLDFSSASFQADDQRLTESLRAAAGKVILPAFLQYVPLSRTEVQLVGTVPLPQFREHARIASINVSPGRDSLVRTQPAYQTWNGERLFSMPLVLAGATGMTRPSFLIDYGINPHTVPTVSYADLLSGNVSRSRIAGRMVLVGSTAVELGDQIAVPSHRVLPSPLVAALAYESIVQGRTLRELSPYVVLAGALLLALFLGPRFSDWSWRRGLAVTAAAWLGFWVLPLAVQASWPVTMDTSPWFLVVGLCYGVGMASSVDRHALAAALFRREADHHKRVIRNLADNTFDGILIIYVDGTVDFFNPAAERLFGYSRHEMVGANVTRLMDAEHVFSDTGRNLPRQGMREAMGIRKDGSTLPVDLVISRIDPPEEFAADPSEDATPSYLMTIRDISERKAAEEDAARHREQMLRVNRMQTMGNLASGLAHELGQPLTAIHFLLYRATQKFGGDESMGEDVAKAMEEAEKAGEIVKELRRFVGRSEVRREVTDVNAMVSEVIDALRYYPGAEDVEVHQELADGLPGVDVDRLMVQQVLSNLVRNALDAMNEVKNRSSVLIVRTAMTADAVIRVEVEDCGIGIPKEVAGHIFQPYYTTKAEGLGYGLALCKTIIEQHGGDITVDSEPGRTVFAFTLAPAATGAATGEQRAANAGQR